MRERGGAERGCTCTVVTGTVVAVVVAVPRSKVTDLVVEAVTGVTMTGSARKKGCVYISVSVQGKIIRRVLLYTH